MLTEEDKKTLLGIARRTVENFLRTGKTPVIPSLQTPALRKKRGVFVTFRKGETLRGCIGSLLPVGELYRATSRMALESAFSDPRFPPLGAEELGEVKIEISVLTVPRKVAGAEEIELGRDGVIIKQGPRQGVFLPQVAREAGWSKEEFLEKLARDKAGLPAGAWKDKTSEIFTFQAEVFSE